MNNKLKNMMNKWPLVVDLDGTLIKTDMLHESSIAAIREKPTTLFKIPIWLFKGKAFLKSQLASLVDINPALLPYNQNLLDWLKLEKSKGRKLVLCTATNIKFAQEIAAHVGIFDEVIASNNIANLSGSNKADVLIKKFGIKGFDYVGNSKVDLHVWEFARNAIVVNSDDDLVKLAAEKADVEHSISRDKVTIKTLFKTFRVHQWLKNTLIFIPILAAHQLTGINTWTSLFVAFVAFSLCASAVYIANDLLDLSSDRQHLRKRHRPFASGALPIHIGVMIIPVLLGSSFWLASYLNVDFSAWLLIYFMLTCAYSLFIKKIVLIDCLTLAVLYTLRILAGAAAAQITLSLWLLAFSIFLFFSLAFVKRYAELNGQKSKKGQLVHGRGYFAEDSSLIQVLGISSAHAALVVLALYLNSEVVVELYQAPKVIWATLPIMLFWISWVWLKAHRNEMHDDPLVFAVKDKASLLAGATFAVVLYIGAKGLPWL